MKPIKCKTFQFEGKDYEIKVFKNNNGFYVQSYYKKGGKRANGYSYHVDFITDYDFHSSSDFHIYEHLIEIAKSDIENNVWEKYLHAIKKSK